MDATASAQAAKERSDAKEKTRAAEVASLRQELDSAKAAAAKDKEAQAAWSASLEKELAARSSEADSLRGKLADTETALKTA